MIKLYQLRNCLEGLVPSAIATCDTNGVPNVSYVSHAHYVDADHLALTYQFFNKTHANIKCNPQVTLLLWDPTTAARYHLALRYKRTEETGPLFQSMKARLASIASSSHMENVFKLRGADIYEVMGIESIDCKTLSTQSEQPQYLLHLRHAISQLTGCATSEELFENLLQILGDALDITYAMLSISDGSKLFTMNSIGYPDSGIGSEVPIGYGVIGTAASYNTPIRISYNSSEYSYIKCLRDYEKNENDSLNLESNINYPGLESPKSQIAVPISDGDKVLGILFAESERPNEFDYHKEDFLVSLCQAAAQCLRKLQLGSGEQIDFELLNNEPVRSVDKKSILNIRYIPETHSIFLDHDYLIKGVAGAVLWRLLQISQEQKRYHFTNRELRLDAAINLPDFNDNLETRLILLRRRLIERTKTIRLEPVSRGSFELKLLKPLNLQLVSVGSNKI